MASGFKTYWIAEAIRLHEVQHGTLEDKNEVERAVSQGHGLADRLLLRARYLGQREGIDKHISRWQHIAKMALLALVIMAIAAGVSASLSVLSPTRSAVNLLMTLTALLGLHLATFGFWVASLFFSGSDAPNSLGQVWLWLSGKLAGREPQASLITRALLGVLNQQRALRSLLGSISHGFWLLVLLASTNTALVLFSLRRYRFHWETTLLDPDTFVRLTQALGWLPSKLGFPVPGETTIRLSDGLHELSDLAYAQWSGWLLGCLVCYGILPRLLALAGTGLHLRWRLKHAQLNPGLSGYAELRNRLEPLSEAVGIDAPAPALHTPQKKANQPAYAMGQAAILGLELSEDQPWPLHTPLATVADLGRIDTRKQRIDAMESLKHTLPERLLLVCDARQTPDRGSLNQIMAFAPLAKQTHIAFIHTESDSERLRYNLWQNKLLDAGFEAEQLHYHFLEALAWLSPDATTSQPPTLREP